MEKGKRDILKEWKVRITSESKHGDKMRACKTSGVTLTTYRNAIKKQDFFDLTDSEMLVLGRHIEILNERKEKQESYANN